MTLPEMETAIRRAVATGAYAEAGRLVSDYCRQLETPEQAAHARDLLDWACRTSKAARAHNAGRRNALATVSQYLRAARHR